MQRFGQVVGCSSLMEETAPFDSSEAVNQNDSRLGVDGADSSIRSKPDILGIFGP